jgi:hypothetical protein
VYRDTFVTHPWLAAAEQAVPVHRHVRSAPTAAAPLGHPACGVEVRRLCRFPAPVIPDRPRASPPLGLTDNQFIWRPDN